MDRMDDDELLGAWLDADLDDDEAARVRDRLERDPGFARRADRVAEQLRDLRGAGRVTVPDGFADRLLARLREPSDETTAPDEPADGQRPDRPRHTSARPTRPATTASVPPPRRRGPSWSRVGAVALAVVVLAGGAAGVVTVLSGGLGGNDSAGETAAMDTDAVSEAGSEMAAEAAPDVPVLVDDGFTVATDEQRETQEQAAGAGEDSGTADAEPAAPEAEALAAVEERLRERLLQAPEAQELLGTPGPQAAELAATTASRVREAPAFDGGARPDACLPQLTDDDTAVTARVEALQLDGEPLLAYTLVRSDADGPLDTVEAWLVDPSTCDVRRFLST